MKEVVQRSSTRESKGEWTDHGGNGRGNEEEGGKSSKIKPRRDLE